MRHTLTDEACKPVVAMQVLVRPSKHANKSCLESSTPIRCCDPARLLEWRYLGIGLMVVDGAGPSQGHLELSMAFLQTLITLSLTFPHTHACARGDVSCSRAKSQRNALLPVIQPVYLLCDG